MGFEQMLRLVRTSAIILLCAMALAAPAAAGQPAAYTAVDIGRLPDTFSTVPWGMNNSTHIVGWGQGPQTQVRPFLWTPQTGIMEFPLPPGFTWGYATDISDTGVIVGTAYNGLGTANQARAWRFINGAHELLPPFPSACPGMVPTAVNDNGDVVGTTCPDGGGPHNAWFYSTDTGLLDLSLWDIATVNDVSNARYLTGQTTGGPAYRWLVTGGRVRKVPPMPPPHNDGATGLAINESRQIAGYGIDVLNGNDAWRAFFYDDASGLVPLVEYPGPFRSGGYGINEQAHVVGNSGTSSTPEMVAWIWTPAGGRVDLITLVSDPNIFGIRRGIDINDSDQIVATATTNDPFGTAVVLIPVKREKR